MSLAHLDSVTLFVRSLHEYYARMQVREFRDSTYYDIEELISHIFGKLSMRCYRLSHCGGQISVEVVRRVPETVCDDAPDVALPHASETKQKYQIRSSRFQALSTSVQLRLSYAQTPSRSTPR